MLQSDLAKIESLVEEAVRQLSSAASASSVRPLDACEVMEAMNRHHLNELLPRIQEADSAFEQLCSHCIDCKVRESELHVVNLSGVLFAGEGALGGGGGPISAFNCNVGPWLCSIIVRHHTSSLGRIARRVALHCFAWRNALHCIALHLSLYTNYQVV